MIKGAVTDLLDDSVSRDQAAQREMLAAVNDETDRLNRLVGNLLEDVADESKALYPARSLQDVGELIAAVVVRRTRQLADHPTTLDLPPDLPPVQISYMHIDQVLTNLARERRQLHAARRADRRRAAADGPQVRVTVRDGGPGIPEGTHARIFEKFARAASERHAKGAGLGLAICKGIVEAHGGQIWAETLPGDGAQFVFTLPLAARLQAAELIEQLQ